MSAVTEPKGHDAIPLRRDHGCRAWIDDDPVMDHHEGILRKQLLHRLARHLPVAEVVDDLTLELVAVDALALAP
jgi:hypothetical protein